MPIIETLKRNSYFLMSKLVFYRFLHDDAVSIRENTWIEIFFIKFEDNIEKFEAGGRELFNIIQEFNEKNRNPSVFPDGNSNNKERNL